MVKARHARADDRFLLALLNSRFYRWYAERRFPPALNGAVRPKLEYVRALPVAVPSRELRAQIETLVTAQLAEPTPARDRALDEAICEAYELSAAERARVLGQVARGRRTTKRVAGASHASEP